MVAGGPPRAVPRCSLCARPAETPRAVCVQRARGPGRGPASAVYGLCRGLLARAEQVMSGTLQLGRVAVSAKVNKFGEFYQKTIMNSE
jgi:hypothetical protein